MCLKKSETSHKQLGRTCKIHVSYSFGNCTNKTKCSLYQQILNNQYETLRNNQEKRLYFRTSSQDIPRLFRMR